MPYAPRATLDNPYGPAVTFRTEDVLPPTAYYVSPDDSITCWVGTDVAGANVNLQIRLLMPTGEVKLLPYIFTQPQLNTWSIAFKLPPVEGYVIGALCWADTVPRGQLFTTVGIMRGSPPSMLIAGLVLLQGYANQTNILSYPGSLVEASFSGRGSFRGLTAPTSTGTGFSFTGPGLTLLRFLYMSFNLATSAAPGNRQVYFALLDKFGEQIGIWPCSITQAPGSTNVYCFSTGGVDKSGGSLISVAGPAELWLPTAAVLQVAAFGLAAGDQFTAITAEFEEWIGF